MSATNSAIVQKPWGLEFELFANESVAIWCLHINSAKATSLHCHPKKRTGYIVAKGEVEIEFLSSVRILKEGDRINFRPGVFHKTKALTTDTVVLELESPVIKQDLLRLEDESGRQTSQYEEQSENGASLEIQNLIMVGRRLALSPHGIKVGNLMLNLISGNLYEVIADLPDETTIALLQGDVFANSKYPIPEDVRLINTAEVTTVSVMRRMSPVIRSNCVVTMLVARKI
jgi:mannose-6-phosphate isomerase-like protein (cupin superfamily)